MIRKIFRNQRGFMLLNVIFLTLIVATCASVLMNAVPRYRNSQAVLKLTAIHLANEQFAMLESFAAEGDSLSGKTSFQGDNDDLKTNNFSAGEPMEFEVKTTVSGEEILRNVKVTVSWTVNGQKNSIEAERTIRVVKN